MSTIFFGICAVVAVGAFTFTLALIAWYAIKVTMGMRVDAEDEIRGLDLSEMGMEAYSSDPLHK